MTGENGLSIKPAHYPNRAPLDAYGDGAFRFANMRHRGALLCLPSGIYGWGVETFEDCNEAAFAPVVREADDIEILLFGTGDDLRPIPIDLRYRFRSLQIMADPMATGAAVRTYNVLLAEGRAVAAALLPVD